jgi:hypothetical protein
MRITNKRIETITSTHALHRDPRAMLDNMIKIRFSGNFLAVYFIIYDKKEIVYFSSCFCISFSAMYTFVSDGTSLHPKSERLSILI